MRDDPHNIAEHLVQEHGIDLALERATEGIAEAQEQGDNYGLSVWREVRRILRERGQGSKYVGVGVPQVFDGVDTKVKAKAAKRGLRKGEFVKPWEWRRGKR